MEESAFPLLITNRSLSIRDKAHPQAPGETTGQGRTTEESEEETELYAHTPSLNAGGYCTENDIKYDFV